ncbi:helix-turn-helix domain-containing protein [Tellurirhabdus bombi]|uniref:helix-turn-helix domain-containing protein n=1 Tax=Tellurirhabdus bombi TaxID=2907205 RepID=UPI001F15F9F2|nr:helix-turn-helix transcriptional regulator [Tellurirhabdus bombi]
MQDFGRRLKALREQNGLSQDQLASLMGKSGKSVVSSWERGASGPSLADLMKLCEILKTTAGYLVDGVEAQPNIGNEPPAGYVLMPAQEVIEMQRQLLKKQADIIREQKS